MPSSDGVLIVCGLKREAAILAGPGRTTLCGDAPTLHARLTAAANFRPSLVVSWGVCGGLDLQLRPGDLVLGSEIASSQGLIGTNEAVTASLAERLLRAGVRVVVRRFASLDAPVVTVEAKAELRRATEAAAVDMESAIAGRYALQQQAPFAILRAVADPAERNLPPLALKAVAVDGGIKIQTIAGELLRSPRQLAALRALTADSGAAFRALKRCRSLLPGLFLGLGAPDV